MNTASDADLAMAPRREKRTFVLPVQPGQACTRPISRVRDLQVLPAHIRSTGFRRFRLAKTKQKSMATKPLRVVGKRISKMKKASLGSKTLFDYFKQRGKSVPHHVGDCKEVSTGPKEDADDTDAYVQNVLSTVSQGRVKLQCSPWVSPTDAFHDALTTNAERAMCGKPLLTPSEALGLIKRPKIFIWSPDLIFPNISLVCPECGFPTVEARWSRP